MAINPGTKYPGNITAPDSDYPYGSARNVSAPGAGDGTPLEQDWVNDWFGFQQAVLDEAGIVPSGVPDKVGASQVLEALSILSLPDWSGFSQIGSGLTVTGTGLPAIAAMSLNQVAFFDAAIGELRMYSWSGTAWSLTGSGLSIAGAGAGALTALSSTDVAFVDETNAEIRLYRWGGAAWSLIGSGLSTGAIGNPGLSALNATDVAFCDGDNFQLRTYRWDGVSAWSQVGTGLAIGGTPGGTTALTSLTADEIAVFSQTTGLERFAWDGSAWSQVGVALSISGATVASISSISSRDLVFVDAANDELRFYRWGNGAFSLTGKSLPVTPAVGNPAIAVMDSGRLAFIGGDVDELKMYGIYSGPYRP